MCWKRWACGGVAQPDGEGEGVHEHCDYFFRIAGLDPAHNELFFVTAISRLSIRRGTAIPSVPMCPN
ncbi:hypothetical protein PTI98_011035 [Pleurotus ostreatus]|nr:hypothetical protein PTI98_011035 [Pleurotus ostreatus]